MANNNLTLEEYLNFLMKDIISKSANKIDLSEEEIEDIIQETYLRLYVKRDKNKVVRELLEYISDNLTNPERFKDDKFKQNTAYIKKTVYTFIWRSTDSVLWLKNKKYKKNKETGKHELQKVDNLNKIDYADIEELDKEQYNVDYNREIDLNLFYIEIQKYANILLCLLSEEEISQIKDYNNMNWMKRQKFVEMFINLIINIDRQTKGFDDEDIRIFWQDILQSFDSKHKGTARKNKMKERFINTSIFKTFKEIFN